MFVRNKDGKMEILQCAYISIYLTSNYRVGVLSRVSINVMFITSLDISEACTGL